MKLRICIDLYSNFTHTGDPDYKLKCIGFWKENLKSYLITYDELDAFSYRCWVSKFLIKYHLFLLTYFLEFLTF